MSKLHYSDPTGGRATAHAAKLERKIQESRHILGDTIARITILGVPRTKKNSQVAIIGRATGKPGIIQSKQWREYERDAVIVGHRPARPISEPVNVRMVFFMPTERVVDLSNLQAGCLDLLVKRGVLEDDRCDIVQAQDGSRVIKGVGVGSAHVEVEIRALGREEANP